MRPLPSPIARSIAALLLALAACTIEPPPPPPAPPPPVFRPLVSAEPLGPEIDTAGPAEEAIIEPRQNLSQALNHLGVHPREIDELVSAFKGHFDFRKVRPGHQFAFTRDEEGRLSWFKYQTGPLQIFHATRGVDGVLSVIAVEVAVQKRTDFVSGEVTEGSLYMAMDAAGERPGLTMSFVDLFAWDIDFFTSTQPHDKFRLLVEKQFVDGKFVAYGKILAAEYRMAEGKTFRAFFYAQKGHPGYYTEDGEAVEKCFLKSPIQFASITSGFGPRFHPIINEYGTHKGIDYGAPSGTAVWAVGDGTVTFASRNGGYGNVVYLKHPNSFETRYAHLSGFGQGVTPGRHVSQKQVIGYVGATGLATGPHLHFEVLVGGQHTNPLRVVVPPSPPIPKSELAGYKESIRPVLEALLAGNSVAMLEQP